jgi:peptidoglycan/xylan/chitin deacetylase (PgdA/CDA1 family)
MYLVKAAWWLKAMYPSYIWHIQEEEKIMYLTFDDGPHATVTPFVLQQLQQYNAKATFFCIGKNVVEQPTIYQQILNDGHSIGNHTHNHLNGWKTNDASYLNNIKLAEQSIQSNLFRPPYGRIKKSQAKQLMLRNTNMKIVMWDVLSGDFDTQLSPQKCLDNVLKNVTQGSIVVFHDSEKAFERLQYALPKTLEHFSNLGYTFKAISNSEFTVPSTN